MAKKQTLKSLLGSSDTRVQTTLDLDDVRFQAPSVRAGQYRVAVQQAPSENTAGQLADALGQLAGPILKTYKSIDTQSQEEFARVANMLTPEQASAISAGDLTGVQESLDELGNQLDSRQRKKLLRFTENPKNYVRASRVIGQKIGTQYGLDLFNNLDDYAKNEEDVQEQFSKVRQKLIEDNNLSGYALEGFLSYANKVETQYAPRVAQAQEKNTENKFLFDNQVTVADQIKQGAYGAAGETFTTNLNGYTPAEQAEQLTTIVNDLISSDDLYEASEFVGWLMTDEQGIKVGDNAQLSDGTRNQLLQLVETAQINQADREDKEAAIEQKNVDKQLGVFIASINRGEVPESFSIDILGEQIEIDGSNINSESDLYDALKSEIYNTDLPETDKAKYYNLLDGASKRIEKEELQQLNSSGLSSAMNVIEKSIGMDDGLGNNLLGMSLEEQQAEAVEMENKLTEGVEAIYADDSLSLAQKDRKAKRFVDANVKEWNEGYKQRMDSYIKTTHADKVVNSLQIGATGNFTPQLQSSIEDYFDITNEADLTEFNRLTSETRLNLVDDVKEIITAPLSKEEEELGDLAQVQINRRNKAAQLIEAAKQTAVLQAEAYTERKFAQAETKEEEVVSEAAIEMNATGDIRNFGTPDPRSTRFEREAVERKIRVQQSHLKRYNDRQNKVAYNNKFDNTTYANDRELILAQRKQSWWTARAFITKHGLYNRGHVQFYDSEATERLYSNSPAVTLDEIRSGVYRGHPDIVNRLDYKKAVFLSPDMVMNPEENRDVILQYATALNLETDEESLNRFLTIQARLMQKNFKLSIYN